MHELTEENFLSEVAKHEMIVSCDDGVYRNIRFKSPETKCMHFDLVTWPGYLCYSGDMGCFVFSRRHDMFDFFRRGEKKHRIDFRYWAEKVEAADRGDGVEKYSHDKFTENILDYIKSHEESYAPDDDDDEEKKKHAAAYAELREEVTCEVLSTDDNPVRAYDAVIEFQHQGDEWRNFHGENSVFEFHDFFEMDCTEYTHRFIWCCYALAWGIERYDKSKEALAALE